MTGVWNEGEMSPRGREMATSSGEREERRPGLMTLIMCTQLIYLHMLKNILNTQKYIYYLTCNSQTYLVS